MYLVFYPLIARERIIGEDSISKCDSRNLHYPITSGCIVELDELENIWNFVFQKLGITPNEHPVVLTESPGNPKANRCKAAQSMFETFE